MLLKQGFGGERLDRDAGNQPVTRHGVAIAELHRGGADEDAFSLERSTRHAAVQQVDEGVMRDGIELDPVIDEIRASERNRRVGNQGGEGGAHRARDPRRGRIAANLPVGIGLDVGAGHEGMAPQSLEGGGVDKRTVIRAFGVPERSEDQSRARCFGRGCQPGIIIAGLCRAEIAEIHVERDQAGTGDGQAVDRLSVVAARPRPVVEPSERLRVDLDDHDLARSRPRQGSEAEVERGVLDRPQLARQRQDRAAERDQARQESPGVLADDGPERGHQQRRIAGVTAFIRAASVQGDRPTAGRGAASPRRVHRPGQGSPVPSHR